jgi:L-alanine-DL-glutamate epimerase-like enolase superfamily enzyme
LGGAIAEMLKAQGHTGFKVKAGGVPLAEDMKRMALVREVIGADKHFMVDVNCGWDLATAVEGARLLEPLRPRWLEEPALGRRPPGAQASSRRRRGFRSPPARAS